MVKSLIIAVLLGAVVFLGFKCDQLNKKMETITQDCWYELQAAVNQYYAPQSEELKKKE